MRESDFWTHLEFRLCHEMAGSELCSREDLWCDGLIPSQYWLREDSPRIEGMAWIGLGPSNQEEWRFRLRLPRTYETVNEIDWAALLPPPEVTDWLAVDLEGKRLEMRPATALPDTEHEHASMKRLEHAIQRLALSATEQAAQYPDPVMLTDELALDFENWRRVCESSRYVHGGPLADHLQLLATHLEAMCGEDHTDLWTIDALHGAPEWREIRRLALNALEAANWPLRTPPRPEEEGDRFVQAGE